MNKLRISGEHYNLLQQHLFPGDGKEAVAVALCGRSIYDGNHTLCVQEVLLIPYESCYERRGDFVHWQTDLINPLLEKASKNKLAILKIHCHPGVSNKGFYEKFSEIDDESDNSLFTSIHAWLDDGLPHASCIMLPDKRIFGRFFDHEMKIETIHQVTIAGSDIHIWHYSEHINQMNCDAQIRNMQTFGEKTVKMLNKMKIGIVGCSGTGSPTVEQLKRLGVGKLVLVDPDFIDTVNLNRIIGSTFQDAQNKRKKVEVMKRGIDETGIGTQTTIFSTHILERNVVKELAECDILFGCVDGAEGRHILNQISTYYIIPLFDLGVKLEADGKGEINGVFGSVHYIQPCGSSLLSRNQYDLVTLTSEGVKRTNNEEFERNKYLVNVNESSPAVISINMQVSSTAINDFLARIHSFRNVSNEEIDVIRIMFADCTTYPETLKEPCPFFFKNVGKGDVEPLLHNFELSNV